MIFGKRVRLRHVERRDLENYVLWMNDPEIREGLDSTFPMSLAEEEIWFEATLERDPVERPFAIEVQEGDSWVHIGGCGFHKFDAIAHKAEIGLLIGAKAYWRQGLATDAMEALVAHGFDTLNLHRIYLRVYEFNEAAVQLYRKLGFVEEARLRQDCFRRGRYWDTIVMGMLRSEWQGDSQQED